MISGTRFRVKGLVALSTVSLLSFMVHTSDDIADRREVTAGLSIGIDGTVMLAVLTGAAYLFAIGWAWKEKGLGYAILLVLSVFPIFYSLFLSHTGGAGITNSFAAIAGNSGAFLVFVSLAGATTSLTTALLAMFALSSPQPRRVS